MKFGDERSSDSWLVYHKLVQILLSVVFIACPRSLRVLVCLGKRVLLKEKGGMPDLAKTL